MSNVVESAKKIPETSASFFEYVFNFDDDSKCGMINMVQYSVLALVPVVLLLKGIKNFVPEDDDSKGSLEILAECVGQIAFIVLAIWFTDKMVRYVPTYSKCNYSAFNSTNFLLPFIILLTTMQTKFGAKLNILADRVVDLWHGKQPGDAGAQQKNNNVRVTQPISGAGQHHPSQADHLDQSQLLPGNPQLTAMPNIAPQPQAQQSGATQQVAPQQSPDFNAMYQEPMAANAAIGGGMFGGSSW